MNGNDCDEGHVENTGAQVTVAFRQVKLLVHSVPHRTLLFELNLQSVAAQSFEFDIRSSRISWCLVTEIGIGVALFERLIHF